MRFVVEIPDNAFMSETRTADHLRQWIREGYGEGVQVMIDDHPDPMDFVKSIYVERADNRTHTQVVFTNGYSICSCSWQRIRVKYASQYGRLPQPPNLREGR